MRRLVGLTLTAILFGIAAFVAWAGVTHRASYVVTNGVSMQPVYHAGDLVVVVRKDSYRVGDIVAFHSGRITVLHRIIDGDADGFITKGDNNESVDPDRPTADDLLGRAVLHVPKAGTWLQRATSPPVIAAVVFFMVTGSGEAVRRRRGRRGAVDRRSTSPARTAAIGSVLTSVMSSPRLRVAAGAIAALGLLGILLGLVAWRQPLTATVTVKPLPGPSMTFSYAATVPLTPAYDGTTVKSPEPVFRKVVKSLDVTFVYAGPPGRVQAEARLSTANGWHTTVPLGAETSFTTAVYRGVVRLDLDLLDARARAGADATGTRASEVSLVVVPRVTMGSGSVFAPALKLKLTPLVLTPDGPLVIQDTAAPSTTVVPQVVYLFGRALGAVSTVRVLSTVLLFGAVLAAAGLIFAARRVRPVAEDERIRRQYRQLLVEAQPMEPPAGRPVVYLADFKTLARLAERYGLLVLHWSTPGSTTFAVHDDTATYRYRIESAAPPDLAAPGAPADAGPHPRDALTSLADRPLFEAAAQVALDASGGERACLLLIDLDDFSTMTEEHGPDAADAVLVAIAERLRQTVRPRDLVACLGGDQFAVLFEDVGPAVVDQIAKRVMRNVNESVVVRGVQIRVRANIGVARAGAEENAQVLMEHATAALADAKAAAEEHLAWFAEIAGPPPP